MLRYGKSDVSEGTDVNKTSVSKVTIGFFKDVGFKFEEYVFNGCHDLLTMAHSLKNISILSTRGTTFRSLLMGTSKSEALLKFNKSVT